MRSQPVRLAFQCRGDLWLTAFAKASFISRLIRSDFRNQMLPLVVFHVEDVLNRPAEVIGDIGYLPVQLLRG